ncbi:hypothetical protein QE430_002634 [Microbacterium testaceum]|uniref:DUF2200 domain-containing protein n=1 Tax=Microbacterium testaceum TaxID=2033 RepID=UPI002783F1A8|nr:DUF2200 domain-containing protein [Microbacterium testaceum]MDQ1174327.1 hypothetical protein [Microbacterium testaceum]
MSRIFDVPFSSVYPLYVAKIERKGRTVDELDTVIRWLTGFDEAELARYAQGTTTFREFFDDARLTPQASEITGVVCGVRVEQVDDPLMYRIRLLDKVVDELAKGKAVAKVMRASAPAAQG